MPNALTAEQTASLVDALKRHRPFLLRLAKVQLSNDALAEDAVQEATIAAWQGYANFQSRANVRTWLVGILRFKILDAWRKIKSEPSLGLAQQLDEQIEQLPDTLLFGEQGQWSDTPYPWWEQEEAASLEDNPEQHLAGRQQLEMIQLCLSRLPEQTARVFLMREYLGFEGVEIAKQLGLQAGHVRIILMRTRLTLRTCLEQRMLSSVT